MPVKSSGKKWLVRHLVALLLVCLGAGRAQAACNVNATGVAFGTIDPLSATDHATSGSVTVTCDSLTGYDISLSPGRGTLSARELANGTHALDYNLYRDAAHNDVWGDGNGSTVTVSGSADSNGQSHTIYGLLPQQPAAVPGSYSDSITVTVTY